MEREGEQHTSFVIVFIIFPPPIFKECTSTIEDLSKKYLNTVKIFAHCYFTSLFTMYVLANMVASGSQFSCPLGMEGAVKRSYLKCQIFRMTSICHYLNHLCTTNIENVHFHHWRSPFKSTMQNQNILPLKDFNFKST